LYYRAKSWDWLSVSPTSSNVRFCTSRDGTRIAFTTSGSGPPLVRAAHWLSHLDYEMQSPLWGPWLSTLGHRHTLIRYDGRGSGLSDRNASDFSLDRCIEDLEAVIDACKLRSFVLFGATIGGITALAYAARNPDRVSRLVIVGGFSVGRMARNPTPEQIEETELELKAIELGWKADNPAFRQFFTSLFIPDATADQARSLNELMRVSSTPQDAINRLRPFHHVDLRNIADKVQCPTLVFHSRADARIPFEQGRALAAIIPGAQFVPLESRNHWVLDTEPAWQQFVKALDDFLPHPLSLPNSMKSFTGVELTRREVEVLEQLARGLDNRTIGRKLGISEKTVRNYVSLLFSKLGVNGRPQAIVQARDAGFGKEAQQS
jgi:pimeloyl-ACP methyl ester carboxylesterase/DNA-binding CsgD family transcriptional regulator